MSDLTLFTWKPPCRVILFPMVSRVGRIRDTAIKMSVKTAKHQAHYFRQVEDALRVQFMRLGIPSDQQDAQLQLFWGEVDKEMVRLQYVEDAGLGGNADA